MTQAMFSNNERERYNNILECKIVPSEKLATVAKDDIVNGINDVHLLSVSYAFDVIIFQRQHKKPYSRQ